MKRGVEDRQIVEAVSRGHCAPGQEDGTSRLFTARSCCMRDGLGTWRYAAVMAHGLSEAEATLGSLPDRGDVLSSTIEEGFDRLDPFAVSMVSPRMADMLEMAAADPSSPAAQGVRVVVEQSFRP